MARRRHNDADEAVQQMDGFALWLLKRDAAKGDPAARRLVAEHHEALNARAAALVPDWSRPFFETTTAARAGLRPRHCRRCE